MSDARIAGGRSLDLDSRAPRLYSTAFHTQSLVVWVFSRYCCSSPSGIYPTRNRSTPGRVLFGDQEGAPKARWYTFQGYQGFICGAGATVSRRASPARGVCREEGPPQHDQNPFPQVQRKAAFACIVQQSRYQKIPVMPDILDAHLPGL